jgi:parallel beta-helix repeat protein
MIGVGFAMWAMAIAVSWSGPVTSVRNSPPPELSKWTVAKDETGQYTSVQEAIDSAEPGDTIWIKAGHYSEDVTIHGKDRLKIIGEGMDLVVLSGLKRVGTLHIGKWPYGARDVEIHGLTVIQHGGLGLGIFNGGGIILNNVHVKGMVFAQQVEDVRMEACIVGESETSGIAFSDSSGKLVKNFIHDNDHGVVLGGTSRVSLEQNVITRSLFESVVVSDNSRISLIRNTLVNNGGGVAFHDSSEGEASGNILTGSKVGFLFSPTSRTTLSFNVLHANFENYQIEGTSLSSDLKRSGKTDVNLPPAFVNPAEDDFRLSSDTPLVNLGGYAYLGALPPLTVP